MGGCEEASGAKPKPSDDPADTHALNPPTWIHGTWGDCFAQTDISWTFSANNIEFTFGSTVTDYSEQSKVSGVTIQDDQGEGWYRFEVRSPDGRGGTVTASNRFVSENRHLRWTTAASGVSTTVNLCRSG